MERVEAELQPVIVILRQIGHDKVADEIQGMVECRRGYLPVSKHFAGRRLCDRLIYVGCFDDMSALGRVTNYQLWDAHHAFVKHVLDWYGDDCFVTAVTNDGRIEPCERSKKR